MREVVIVIAAYEKDEFDKAEINFGKTLEFTYLLPPTISDDGISGSVMYDAAIKEVGGFVDRLHNRKDINS